jgi:hypothetical protein
MKKYDIFDILKCVFLVEGAYEPERRIEFPISG